MIHKGDTRGLTDTGWLKSYHTFSFGEYYDQTRLGFNTLRVFNDDTVSPGMGFGMHGHKDMEIISVVVEGTLEHEDSIGNKGLINTCEVQTISAGTGIKHSEWNGSKTESVHFLQLWVDPSEKGLEPSYNQKLFDWNDRRNQLIKICGGESYQDNSAIKINQNVGIFISRMDNETGLAYIPTAPHLIQVIAGSIELEDEILEKGDFYTSSDNTLLKINSVSAETLIILFSF